MWSVGASEDINIPEDRWLKKGVLGGPANFKDPPKVVDLIMPKERRWDEHTFGTHFDEQIVDEVLPCH